MSPRYIRQFGLINKPCIPFSILQSLLPSVQRHFSPSTVSSLSPFSGPPPPTFFSIEFPLLVFSSHLSPSSTRCILNHLKAPPNIIVPTILHPQPIPNPILSLYHGLRQGIANAKEHEERPLPAERVNCNAEREPPDQLKISEEVEGSGRGESLDEARHVDPAFHPESSGASERVREEH